MKNKFGWFLNPLSANPTKWSNTLKQFVGNNGLRGENYLSFKKHLFHEQGKPIEQYEK